MQYVLVDPTASPHAGQTGSLGLLTLLYATAACKGVSAPGRTPGALSRLQLEIE
jgi:hypothetical protein